MEHTDGLGRKAEIWVDGNLLTVCDGVSTSSRRQIPGPLENIKISYPSMDGFSWYEAAEENPSQKMYVKQVSGWSYDGYGKILSVMPAVIDFGMFRLEDPNWCTDEQLVGRYVHVPIQRLEISPKSEGNTDWPEELR